MKAQFRPFRLQAPAGDDDEVSGFVRATTSDYRHYVKLWRHGPYVFGRVLRHDRWWLAKSVARDADDAEMLGRLLNKEFQLGLSLDCPSIVRVVDFQDLGEAGPSIIMEYVEGETLGRAIEQGLKPREALGLWRELVEAVRYMHQRCICHGDLKGGNVMITREGPHVKLIDLGHGDAHWSALRGTKGEPREDIQAMGQILGQLRPLMPWRWRLALWPVERRASRGDIEEVEGLEPSSLTQRLPLMAAVAMAVAAVIMVWLLWPGPSPTLAPTPGQEAPQTAAAPDTAVTAPKAVPVAVEAQDSVATPSTPPAQEPAVAAEPAMPAEPAAPVSPTPTPVASPAEMPRHGGSAEVRFMGRMDSLRSHNWKNRAELERIQRLYVEEMKKDGRSQRHIDSVRRNPVAMHQGLAWLMDHDISELSSAGLERHLENSVRAENSLLKIKKLLGH